MKPTIKTSHLLNVEKKRKENSPGWKAMDIKHLSTLPVMLKTRFGLNEEESLIYNTLRLNVENIDGAKVVSLDENIYGKSVLGVNSICPFVGKWVPLIVNSSGLYRADFPVELEAPLSS